MRAHDYVMDTVLSPWTDLRQGLVKRHADYTREQFSENWLKHAAKVTPWGLENGIKYYAQVCAADAYQPILLLRCNVGLIS